MRLHLPLLCCFTFLSSCREDEESAERGNKLENYEKFCQALDKGTSDEIAKAAKALGEEKPSVQDFMDVLGDRRAIEAATAELKLGSAGLASAKAKVLQRIAKRGRIPELVNALGIIEAAETLRQFNRGESSEWAIDRRREFTFLLARTQGALGKAPAYREWTAKEDRELTALEKEEHQLAAASLRLSTDFSSVSHPELLPILRLQQELIPKNKIEKGPLEAQITRLRTQFAKIGLMEGLAQLAELEKIVPVDGELRLQLVRELLAAKKLQDQAAQPRPLPDATILIELLDRSR
ncbi:MAG: hypothetical protein RL095_2806 [Verrucomicrobiota bacterium]|jgi:hypothetical protein